MEAIQIRTSMIDESSEVDVVLSGNQFNNINVDGLRDSFNNIYFVPENGFTRKEQLIFLLKPLKAIKQIGISCPQKYTDVFFFNPGWAFYYVFKCSSIYKYNFKWHCFQDGTSSYFLDGAEALGRSLMYGKSGIQMMMRFFDTCLGLSNGAAPEDEYMWGRDLRVSKIINNVVEIPRIEVTDDIIISKLNRVFPPAFPDIREKIIYLDAGYGYLYDDYGWNSLIEAVKTFGKRMAVIPHPTTSLERYASISNKTNIIENKYPWEFACLNHCADNKILIGPFTGALVNPIIVSNLPVEVYVFEKGLKMDNVDGTDEISKRICAFLKKMEGKYQNFHVLDNYDIVVTTLSRKE